MLFVETTQYGPNGRAGERGAAPPPEQLRTPAANAPPAFPGEAAFRRIPAPLECAGPRALTRCTRSHTSLVLSDPKARSALHTRKGVKSTQFTSSLARIGDTAQSVRASDTNDCRYQHPPAMAAKFRSSPYMNAFIYLFYY